MIDKLLELSKVIELVLLVAVVEFFQVLPDVLAVVEEAHLGEIEEKEEVELFALLEDCLILLEDLHDPGDVPQRSIAGMLQFTNSTQST